MTVLVRHRLTPAAAMPEGSARRCAVPGRRPFAVFRVGGAFFVTDDMCTHGMASLTEGTLDGAVIECPWHGGAFDVRTGQAVALPCVDRLRTYPAVIEDGWVCIDLAPAPSRRLHPAMPAAAT
jgi:nitrite reductase/ring-hydroxylating ferredoxin subunit